MMLSKILKGPLFTGLIKTQKNRREYLSASYDSVRFSQVSEIELLVQSQSHLRGFL